MPPSAKKRLEWRKTARLEFIEAIAYYANLNPTAAQRMHDEIYKAALSLVDPIPTPGRPGSKAGTFERMIGRRKDVEDDQFLFAHVIPLPRGR